MSSKRQGESGTIYLQSLRERESGSVSFVAAGLNLTIGSVSLLAILNDPSNTCAEDPVGADPDPDGIDSEGPELEGADPGDVEHEGAGLGAAEF
ncbi:hypothetical protein ACFX14_035846 [Malus domestica]